MRHATHRHEGGPRAKRGLPRPCKGCGQSFRPKNNKGKFCSEACQKARGRLEAKTGHGRDPDSCVAHVGFRSKSSNENNGVSGRFAKPRVTAKTGWQFEASGLVFYLMPDTPSLTEKERRALGCGHKVMNSVVEVAA
jgi:hypothetical protein